MNTNQLGKNQLAAFNFISRVSGWHTYAKKETRTLKTLEKRGLVELNEFQQFRLA